MPEFLPFNTHSTQITNKMHTQSAQVEFFLNNLGRHGSTFLLFDIFLFLFTRFRIHEMFFTGKSLFVPMHTF